MNRTIITAALILSAAPAVAQVDFRGNGNSPVIIAPDNSYRGNLNNNKFDPNSISNPYGKYGSQFSPDSVNNRFGTYGNPYSPQYSNPYGANGR
jgi:hypothetical protein